MKYRYRYPRGWGLGLCAIPLIMSCSLGGKAASQTLTIGPVNLEEIALQRSQFGQPKNPTPEHAFYTTLNAKAITLLFPVGTANLRYLILQNPDSQKVYLSCQSKAKNTVKMEWAVELERTHSPASSDLNGTLVKMLANDPYGLTLKLPVPEAARTTLSATGAFAAYELTLGDLSCWLVEPSGHLSYVSSNGIPGDRQGMQGISNLTWPLTPKPYPICTEERALFGR